MTRETREDRKDRLAALTALRTEKETIAFDELKARFGTDRPAFLATISAQEHEDLSDVFFAAKSLVEEYESHGGRGTHRACPSVYCLVPRYVKALKAAIAKAEGR